MCRFQLMWRRYRRNMGERPKTWMLKRTRLKTWVVVGRREASTTEAMMAALVEREAGNLRRPGLVLLFSCMNEFPTPLREANRSKWCSHGGLLYVHLTGIIKRQTIGQKQPRCHRPNRVRRDTFRQTSQNRGQSEKGTVYQSCGLCRIEPPLCAFIVMGFVRKGMS